MARNHVWRYTLRLFHTFAIFEKKNRKINEKRDPESHCVRRALTAAPLGGNRRVSFSGEVFWETAKTAIQLKNSPKWHPKTSKINENGVQNRLKINPKINQKMM